MVEKINELISTFDAENIELAFQFAEGLKIEIDLSKYRETYEFLLKYGQIEKGLEGKDMLVKLGEVELLYLRNTEVSDVSALSNLTNLEWLYFSNTEVSDVSALSKLTKLDELSLYNTKVSDVSALSNLTNLKSLSLYNTKVSDVQVQLLRDKGVTVFK